VAKATKSRIQQAWVGELSKFAASEVVAITQCKTQESFVISGLCQAPVLRDQVVAL
jgi:hypothetical protein